ncbi:chorismate-binding protein [Hwangdonia lutea]|uniref:Chorismate-binding protein n=1 Tax=Hwangdonia lutea TaxID=3075823 RepID=A0AA97EL97_9FLAO|nr:chorismate-binding protein [Hwangdonia sp. SCSIO 19198]WOD43192.1 chorismate-binding protein [Hwangdonia sp. SCSIO 19198]
MEDFFNRIETQYRNHLPFVVYRKPNEDVVKAILQQTNGLHFTRDFTEKGFVFSPFDDAEDSILIPVEDSEVISMSQQFVIPADAGIHSNSHSVPMESESKKFHINLIKKGIKAITEKAFEKVVLSRHETVNLSNSNPISILKTLLKTYKSAFVYCWYHPKVGLWLGATPETLIKIEGKQLSIMALAGTQDYKGTLDVVWEAKEKDEQHIVTQFVAESLRPWVENLKIGETETVKAGNLLHLKTMISARLLSDSKLKDIVSVLHPTPAVCGFPKLDAKQFILKHENYNREFYTGFLGELNFETTKTPRSGKRNIENRAYAIKQKSTQLYVNLRCMQIKNDKAIIYIGGGITESSIPESEWEETVSKSLVIKSVL